MTSAHVGQSASDDRPGYDDAVDMAICANAGTVRQGADRDRAAIDAAYPIIEAALRKTLEHATGMTPAEVRADERRRVVTWLRTCGLWPVSHLGDSAAIAIEREFGGERQ